MVPYMVPVGDTYFQLHHSHWGWASVRDRVFSLARTRFESDHYLLFFCCGHFDRRYSYIECLHTAGLDVQYEPAKKMPANQKGYNNSDTTIAKFMARRIQICRVPFCIINLTSDFKITFQITSKQNGIRKV